MKVNLKRYQIGSPSSLALVLFASSMLWGCSQSADGVAFYHYGEARQIGAGSLGLHTIRNGETLWSISKAYNVDLRDMLDLNRLRAPYRIGAGQRLKIPAPLTYTVRRGDTLYRVSRVFDTTTTELAQLNALRTPYRLNVGQNLRLPTRHRATAQVIESAPEQMTFSKSNHDIERQELAPLPHASPPSYQNSKLTSAKPQSETRVAQNFRPITRSGKGFLKPVNGKIISSYGAKADGLHNDGVNIKAARGDAVLAAENGVIVFSGKQIEGYGNLLLVRHADGYMTAYAHMDKVLVKEGDKVLRGQSIGTVGTTGHVQTPQLHFEIRKGKDAVNPIPYLG